MSGASRGTLAPAAVDHAVDWVGLIAARRSIDSSFVRALALTARRENCLLLARVLGFASSNSSVLRFSHETCIVVERYDRFRDMSNNEYVRVHQEDMCQALSVMPALKCQRYGGPSIRHVVRLLRENSSAALEDTRQFVRGVALNFIILGTDAHAKNFSVIMAPGQSRIQVRLAPLYDVNSYLPYTDDKRSVRMSMSVGSK